jgi:hypothetical protein
VENKEEWPERYPELVGGCLLKKNLIRLFLNEP